MYSINDPYFGPVGRFLGDSSYQTRFLGNGDTLERYITLRGGCWVLGKITGENSVEFSLSAVTDPHKSNQTMVLILGDQLDLRDRLLTGGISFNDSYFQDLKHQLGEKKALLTELVTNPSQITPEETEKRQLIEARIWLGTGGDSSCWQKPKRRSAEELSGQIASLDTVIARL